LKREVALKAIFYDEASGHNHEKIENAEKEREREREARKR